MSVAYYSRSPTLRTKRGCVCCRNRRKKCDERKPICATCERLGLRCHWPDVFSIEDRRKRGAVNSRWSPDPKLSPNASASNEKESSSPLCGFSAALDTEFGSIHLPMTNFGILTSAKVFLRSDREIFLLTSYYEDFLPANILPTAHADFSKIYVGDVIELKNTIMACSAIYLSNKQTGSPIEALDYYARAVSGLRRRLDSGILTGMEDWLLAVTVLMFNFETWRCESDRTTRSAAQHLDGAIQLLKIRCKTPRSRVDHYFDVLMAEAVLFHMSTLLGSDFSAMHIEVSDEVWDSIDLILDQPLYEDRSLVQNHPVLGTHRKLNRLVFEISRLFANRPRKTTENELEAKRLDAELQVWERGTDSFGECNLKNSFESQEPYVHIQNLYIICARILLIWTSISEPTTFHDSSTDSCASLVESKLSEAIGIIQDMNDSNHNLWNFLMRWPLYILGHAGGNEVANDIISDALERIWLRSSCGDVRRSLHKLQQVWSQRRGGSGDLLKLDVTLK